MKKVTDPDPTNFRRISLAFEEFGCLIVQYSTVQYSTVHCSGSLWRWRVVRTLAGRPLSPGKQLKHFSLNLVPANHC